MRLQGGGFRMRWLALATDCLAPLTRNNETTTTTTRPSRRRAPLSSGSSRT